jgi:histidinol dehydrogenase
MKTLTFQKLDEEGIRGLGPTIEVMAAAEGLDAHRRAVSIRREYVGS